MARNSDIRKSTDLMEEFAQSIVTGITSFTTNIRDGAVEMNIGTESILKEIMRLSDISQFVQDRSASIAKAIDTITARPR